MASSDEKATDVKKSKKELVSAPAPAKALIYCGPNLAKGALAQYAIFKGGFPKHLDQHFEKCPAIKRLFVEPVKLDSTVVAINKPGTPQSVWFKQISDYVRGGGK
ncbi:hypothetical protein Dred_1211 [Desulforamulus reducens MI-1]|uniref:Uncharacterized protein n=1 Tax=Desulforamulus reducens (strain ATCC BAA-1160 / DSM 100696 / MI-1) TaxID=349161 RepID=A4J3U2_DESRM|nr:hypothetical protein [Desulforamulus reducens]ABO49745.1 hypothetical protein Dred_1211 [Desulforamulus reducens MI-1]